MNDENETFRLITNELQFFLKDQNINELNGERDFACCYSICSTATKISIDSLLLR